MPLSPDITAALTKEQIDLLIEKLEASDADVATPVFQITNLEDVTNPNVVKVVRGPNNDALYFSRSPIPHVRDVELNNWLTATPFWGHTGVYAYRRQVLYDYLQLPEGAMEKAEKLEQLRLLEAGRTILTVEIDYRTEGVDTPEDLEVFNQVAKHLKAISSFSLDEIIKFVDAKNLSELNQHIPRRWKQYRLQ